MNDEAQRSAIADALPWIQPNYAPGKVWFSINGELQEMDPLNELNAMHEAEKVLTWEQGSEYKDWLYQHMPLDQHLFHATAAQRAEAFLRTLGKWKDE